MKVQQFITIVLLVSVAAPLDRSTAQQSVGPRPLVIQPDMGGTEIASPSTGSEPALTVAAGNAFEGASGLAERSAQAATPTQGVSADWCTVVQEDIRQSEYHITWQDRTYLPDLRAAYQAPNRAHNLRTYFTPTGIRVIQRTATTPTWEWGLSLTGYGYAGDIKSVTAAKLAASGNRIEYQRGGLTEWYVNDERGLEQGFTLAAAPKSLSPNLKSQIHLELALTGDLTPHLTDDNQTIEFNRVSGECVLRYSDLHVHDATGRQLPAYLSLSQSYLSIWIDDRTAVYPVTIDPLSTTPNWTVEGGQIDAFFGNSVGTAGNVNGKNVDGKEYDDVIVGASFYDGGQKDEGAAFVYYGSAKGLSKKADWMAEGDQALAFFGYSVGTAGDVNGDGYDDVIIGAWQYTKGQKREGAAFVFHGSKNGLKPLSNVITDADWIAEGNQAYARFGISVGTAGNVNGKNVEDGKEYDDVIVGADDPKEGHAYVYYGSAKGVSKKAKWTANGPHPKDFFGHSVGTAGDVNGDDYDDVIIGAYWYTKVQAQEGAAFVFHGSKNGLKPVSNVFTDADWMAEGNNSGAYFGISVGRAGDVNGDHYDDVIVGAWGGQAYVYYGGSTKEKSLSNKADWTGSHVWSFGRAVGTAGDVNKDGYDDVIIGAPASNSINKKGRAFVFYGSGYGLTPVSNVMTDADWIAEGTVGTHFGISVGTAGDVDGNGVADVIIGESAFTGDKKREGRAYVYHGFLPTPPPITERYLHLLYKFWELIEPPYPPPPAIVQRRWPPAPFLHSLLDETEKAYLEHSFGRIAYLTGLYRDAERFYRQSLSEFHEFGNTAREANVLRSLGELYSAQGRDDEAVENFQSASNLHQSVEDYWGLAYDRISLGFHYLAKGEASKSFEALEEALGIQERISDSSGKFLNFLYQTQSFLTLGYQEAAVACLILAEDLLSATEDSESRQALNQQIELVIVQVGEREFLELKENLAGQAEAVRREAISHITQITKK